VRLLLFGGAGQLGRAVQAAAAARGWVCAAPGRAEADVTVAAAVARAVAAVRPAAVLNAAAYTAVDRAEAEPEQAEAVNAAGAGHVARAAAAGGAILLHVSTDYVFDGGKGAPYVESDPVRPLQAYGRSKLDGERAVQATLDRHLVVRTAWLFSADGQSFVRTMLRLGRERGAVSVVDDEVGCPTPAGPLAAALLDMLAAAGRPGFAGWGVYHLAGAPAVSRCGFARAIFAAAGLAVRVSPIGAAAFNAPAPRPASSALDCGKAARAFALAPIDWRAALPATVAGM
jgi:dTDP-4-dehydrorhamnose reductase